MGGGGGGGDCDDSDGRGYGAGRRVFAHARHSHSLLPWLYIQAYTFLRLPGTVYLIRPGRWCCAGLGRVLLLLLLWRVLEGREGGRELYTNKRIHNSVASVIPDVSFCKAVECSVMTTFHLLQVSGSKLWQTERSCMCCQESGEREAAITLSCPKARPGEPREKKV